MILILNKLGISFQRQYCILGKYYDFYLKDYNVLIQVDGVYWHGKNLKMQMKNLIQARNGVNDIKKNLIAKMKNISLYRVWEDEIDINKVKKILNQRAKINRVKKEKDRIVN